MSGLPDRIDVYCDRINENVPCDLTHVQNPEAWMAGDVYICPHIGTEKSPECRPCSNYGAGRFVLIPNSTTNKDGSINMKKLTKALNIRRLVEVPFYDI